MLLPAQVALRDGGRIEAAPSELGVRGVAFSQLPAVEGAIGNVLGWDRVRDIGGEGSWATWKKTADAGWRARTRLERADAASAEPIFEELFAEYAGRNGPTAAMVDQGLLACRLYRGAQLTAVMPWVCWLRCGTPEEPLPRLIDLSRTAAQGSIGIAVAPDRATGLVPQLPPIFVETPALQAFARSDAEIALAAGETAGPLEARAQAMWRWYLFAAKAECKLESMPPEGPGADDAVVFVSQIVFSRTGDAPQREKARTGLRERLKDAREPWAEAWCRAAIGRSLLLEQDAESRLLGVVELLHVPARLAEQSSYLTGVALAEAAVALKGLGDLPGADRMHAELLDRFTGHPAAEWTPVRAWPTVRQSSKKPENPKGEAAPEPAPGPPSKEPK